MTTNNVDEASKHPTGSASLKATEREIEATTVDIAKLSSLLSLGNTEDNADVFELLARLENVDSMAHGVEDKLDGILDKLDSLLTSLETGEEVEKGSGNEANDSAR